MNLYTINTELFKLDGGAMYGVVPKSIWNKLNPADENNLCTWAMRCLLIEDGNRLVLVDNGVGGKQDEKFFSHYFLHGPDTLESSLKQHGFSPADVTDVLLTHLHFDHCGGSIVREGEKLVPAFKNATYWSNEAHWKWATEPNVREKASFLKENILPIEQSGQLKMVEQTDGVEFMPGVKIRFVSGHTEAMMLPQLSYKGRELVYMADLIPSVGHIPLSYIAAYDTRPLDSMTEKKTFLEEAAAGNYLLYFEHDPVNECCELKRTEKGIRAGEGFQLSAL